MKYIRLIGIFIRAAVQNESAYRLNFMMSLLGTVLSLAGGIGGIMILYSASDSLNGWSRSETMAVLGVYMLVLAFNGLFVSPSMHKLGGMDGEIQTGAFDYTLLRPVSKQFYVSMREWSVWPLLDVAAGIGVILFAAGGMEGGVTAVSFLFFLLSLLISLGMLYSIMLILSSAAFWYQGSFLLWIMGDMLQAGRYPISIYPKWVRLALTWVFPIGFIVSVPAEALVQRAEPLMLLAGLALLTVLFAAATLFFHLSLRRYTGASS